MPQKRSLKQMEKQQMLREQKAGGRESSRIEKTVGGIDMPDINSKEFLDRLRRMRAITPTHESGRVVP